MIAKQYIKCNYTKMVQSISPLNPGPSGFPSALAEAKAVFPSVLKSSSCAMCWEKEGEWGFLRTPLDI